MLNYYFNHFQGNKFFKKTQSNGDVLLGQGIIKHKSLTHVNGKLTERKHYSIPRGIALFKNVMENTCRSVHKGKTILQ